VAIATVGEKGKNALSGTRHLVDVEKHRQQALSAHSPNWKEFCLDHTADSRQPSTGAVRVASVEDRSSFVRCNPDGFQPSLIQTVDIRNPFVLSLSKGAFSGHLGFDKLSPNGIKL